MGMTVGMVTFDTHDARELATWWAQRTGGEVQAFDDEFVMVRPPGAGPVLGFQRVGDPTPGKNRVHLDITAQDAVAEVERLVAAGARKVADHAMPDGFTWTVLADPHGNQFCVAPELED